MLIFVGRFLFSLKKIKKSVIKRSDDDFVKFVCEICNNIINCNVTLKART